MAIVCAIVCAYRGTYKNNYDAAEMETRQIANFGLNPLFHLYNTDTSKGNTELISGMHYTNWMQKKVSRLI